MADKPDHKHEGLEGWNTVLTFCLFILILMMAATCTNTYNRIDRIEAHINLCPLKTEGFLEEQGLTCDDLIRQGMED